MLTALSLTKLVIPGGPPRLRQETRTRCARLLLGQSLNAGSMAATVASSLLSVICCATSVRNPEPLPNRPVLIAEQSLQGLPLGMVTWRTRNAKPLGIHDEVSSAKRQSLRHLYPFTRNEISMAFYPWTSSTSQIIPRFLASMYSSQSCIHRCITSTYSG